SYVTNELNSSTAHFTAISRVSNRRRMTSCLRRCRSRTSRTASWVPSSHSTWMTWTLVHTQAVTSSRRRPPGAEDCPSEIAGQGTWIEHRREICRRAENILNTISDRRALTRVPRVHDRG